MKKGIIWILPILLLSVFFLASCSEDDKTSAFNKIKEKLALTEEKAALVKPIFDEQADKISAALEEAKNNRPDMSSNSRPSFQPGEKPQASEGGQSKMQNPMAEKLKPINEDADSKLSTILTADQITEYNNIINEYIEKVMEANKPSAPSGGGMGGPGGGMGGPGGGMGGPGGGIGGPGGGMGGPGRGQW